MNNLKILSLEDDNALSLVMGQYFEDEGHQFTNIRTGQDCIKILQTNEFDVVLMDLGLPDMDGLSLIPQIKQFHHGVLIVVSGKSDTTDRIVGLEMGADDYLIKPFEMRELMARIKANMRRQSNGLQISEGQKTATALFKFNDYVFDESRLCLFHQGNETIELTSSECELLSLFLNSKGRALSREYLHENTRGDNYDTFDRAVDIAVTRLRKKLNDNPSAPKLIKTIRGVGYMFLADIEKSPAN